jgi:methyl-accepting chemotaxis protein
MKYKNLKLGTKLTTGFGVLIAISLLLGTIAILNMNKITKKSKILALEYIPEVKIATNLQRASSDVMYEMRGYGFTEEESYYQQALKEIEALKKAIQEGHELNKRAKQLTKLAEELEVAKDATATYLNMVDEMVKVNQNLDNQRNNMDIAATIYMENCTKYLDNQRNSMLREIRAGKTTENRLAKISQINEIMFKGNEIRVDNYKSQAKRDPKIFKEALNSFPGVFGLIEEIKNNTRLASNTNAVNQIEEQGKAYQEAMETFIAQWVKREELSVKLEQAGHELIQTCIKTANAGFSGTQDIANESISTLRTSSAILIDGLLIALIIGILSAIFLTRSITRPIYKGVLFAKKLSEGDLTAKIDVDQKDEVGQLAAALSNMGTKLREIVENILSGANNIASASQQMSGTSQEMSQGASEQASSVEEVTSSMEEMAANIEQNTENAQSTEKIALNAAKGIVEGSDATNIAVEGMKNIAEKIRIINDIAFQTNILALNAAVEAARAGEHGKGFAVVAAEVRKLAERSKVAADEIDELSRSGVEIAEKAGKKLTDIVPDIEKTAQMVQEIASASLEQRSGSNQVNSAMEQLNNVTQQNAAASEEMATGAEELASQADQLKEIILYFNIGDDYKKGIFHSLVSKQQETEKENKPPSPSKGKEGEPFSPELYKEKILDQEFENF